MWSFSSPDRLFCFNSLFSGCQGFLPQVWIQQVLSLSCSFSSSRLWCGFLIENLKLLLHSCLTTVPLSHTGHCPLPFPVIVVSLLPWSSRLLLLFLSRDKGGRETAPCREVWDLWKYRKMRKRQRSREVERICWRSSKTHGEAEKAASSCSRSRWSECVRERRREGGWWRVRWEAPQSIWGKKNGRKDEEWRGGDLLFMCLW